MTAAHPHPLLLDAEAIAALRESERRFRAIANGTYDWESWHGPEGKLLWVNNAVERMTGYAPDECLSMHHYPFPMICDRDQARIAEVLKQAAAGIPGNDVEFTIRNKTGRESWGAISWQSITDTEGNSMGFRTSVRDIADRKQMEQQIRNHTENLEQLVRERTARLMELEVRRSKVDRLAALGQLAAGVAHEINNPLAGIRNAIELVRDSLPDNFDDRPLLDMVQSEIDRIGGIVRQLYQLHRPQTETDSDVDLLRLVQQTKELLSGVCRRFRVQIHVNVPEDQEISARLPEGEMKQVLYNVLLNAIQASPASSVVEIELKSVHPWATIAVADQGPGIPDDVLPKIFDPFFTTKHGTLHNGMGLGLSVSQSIIQAIGGRIDVETRRGQTTFTLIVPQRSRAVSVSTVDEGSA